MNRRDFLRRMTLVGIGAALFPFFPDAQRHHGTFPPLFRA